MAGAEGLAGLDLDRQVVGPHLVAVMGAVDEKAAGADRLEGSKDVGHPVLVGQFLAQDFGSKPLDRRFGGYAGCKTVRVIVGAGGVDVDRDFEDLPGLIDLDDGERRAVILEGGFEAVVEHVRRALAGDGREAGLRHQDETLSPASIGSAAGSGSPGP